MRACVCVSTCIKYSYSGVCVCVCFKSVFRSVVSWLRSAGTTGNGDQQEQDDERYFKN